MSNEGIHVMISYTHSRLLNDAILQKITRFGEPVCVGGQCVVDYYMMQFSKKILYFGGLVCVRG